MPQPMTTPTRAPSQALWIEIGVVQRLPGGHEDELGGAVQPVHGAAPEHRLSVEVRHGAAEVNRKRWRGGAPGR